MIFVGGGEHTVPRLRCDRASRHGLGLEQVHGVRAARLSNCRQLGVQSFPVDLRVHLNKAAGGRGGAEILEREGLYMYSGLYSVRHHQRNVLFYPVILRWGLGVRATREIIDREMFCTARVHRRVRIGVWAFLAVDASNITPCVRFPAITASIERVKLLKTNQYERR